MKLFDLLQENTSFNNWTRFTDASLESDFQEYKQKEQRKWQPRAEVIQVRWPLFKDIQEFRQALISAPIVDVDSLRSVANMTKNRNIEDIKDMVSSYQLPRDVARIQQGYQENHKLPLPIIIKGQQGMWIMAGNTRQSVARVMGITPRALLVDVSARP
tara:strand:- start:28386 stop:28859 length:474 start_codon:yes stop_codon:yes gene_type:complete